MLAEERKGYAFLRMRKRNRMKKRIKLKKEGVPIMGMDHFKEYEKSHLLAITGGKDGIPPSPKGWRASKQRGLHSSKARGRKGLFGRWKGGKCWKGDGRLLVWGKDWGSSAGQKKVSAKCEVWKKKRTGSGETRKGSTLREGRDTGPSNCEEEKKVTLFVIKGRDG